MKKLLVLFFIFLCGCSSKVVLNCSYGDNSSIFGNRKTTDIITFKNDKILSYKRNLDFDLHSGMDKDSKSVYRIIKFEGKALKKYIGGRYRITHSGNSVSLSFNSGKVYNLKYIGIDSNYGYDQVKCIYEELGFNCK